jgi:hypothetical protein
MLAECILHNLFTNFRGGKKKQLLVKQALLYQFCLLFCVAVLLWRFSVSEINSLVFTSNKIGLEVNAEKKIYQYMVISGDHSAEQTTQ